MIKMFTIASLFMTTAAFAAITNYDYEPEVRAQHEKDHNMPDNASIQCINAETGARVGKAHFSHVNWHFRGQDSACPKCNPDWCNTHEVGCTDQNCTTVIEEGFAD